ncbi:hypothetical protein Q9Y70_000652 [Escherichia coli]|uniref:hypothetical protein n=1 Tax=Escherichia coli TaxID=562 RepID=UPI001F10A237|nr:hypothetical protein [Escherichia coli]ELH6270823.1 hypothetical protein [Escherichia coli]MCH4712728.1 hypothetical protein [Escherichia coli]
MSAELETKVINILELDGIATMHQLRNKTGLLAGYDKNGLLPEAIKHLIKNGIVERVYTCFGRRRRLLGYRIKQLYAERRERVASLFSDYSVKKRMRDISAETGIPWNYISRTLRLMVIDETLCVDPNRHGVNFYSLFKPGRFGHANDLAFDFDSRLNEYRKNNGLLPDKPVFEIEKLNGETGLEL